MILENIINSTKEFVKNNKEFCVSVAALAAAGAADVYVTSASMTNLSEEGNLMFRHMLENYGTLGLIVPKLLAAPLFIYIARKTKRNYLLAIPAISYTLGALSWLTSYL